jgi:alpha-galactosidase
MKLRSFTPGLALALFTQFASAQTNTPAFWSWAEKPVMGWNSWDCFATTITEAQTKAQADVMAKHLLPYGWKYLTVDIQWYEPNATGFDYRKGAPLIMDGFSRLLPATNRFPSSANGAGFKPLADYVHSQGLLFGIHLMRGIPRQAVRANTPIKGTTARAADIANTNSVCSWNGDMYGVDMSKPGAQEYYNSVFELIASWDVDLVKVDDLSRPYGKNRAEIEAIRKAIDRTGRKIVLSTSPGETPVAEGPHVMLHANQWRISDDFWDTWGALMEQFTRCHNWEPYIGRGHFPDADMLPLGTLDMGRRTTRFTRDEQFTLMTLWSIVRSPLIMGGDLTKLDAFTESLLTNPEVIAVNQNSSGNRQLFRRDGFIAWVGDIPGSTDRYLALFNTRNKPSGPEAPATAKGVANLAEVGFTGPCKIRDLWMNEDRGEFTGQYAPELPWHGAGLYRVSGQRANPPASK